VLTFTPEIKKRDSNFFVCVKLENVVRRCVSRIVRFPRRVGDSGTVARCCPTRVRLRSIIILAKTKRLQLCLCFLQVADSPKSVRMGRKITCISLGENSGLTSYPKEPGTERVYCPNQFGPRLAYNYPQTDLKLGNAAVQAGRRLATGVRGLKSNDCVFLPRIVDGLS